MLHSKRQLYILCREYVSGKTGVLSMAINDLQDAIANETKSSAGDKYETTREMLEQEINLKLLQLNELKKLNQVLDKINPDIKATTIVAGSLVITSQGNYYIAISAGSLLASGNRYYAVSIASPIGNSMAGLKPDDAFEFNGKKYVIEEVL